MQWKVRKMGGLYIESTVANELAEYGMVSSSTSYSRSTMLKRMRETLSEDLGSLEREKQRAIALARQAGALLLKHQQAGVEVEHKTSQEDPVTIADREASVLIMEGLKQAFPEDGLLSEEEPDNKERLKCDRVWIIDPIDGTREFTQNSPDFCVSIGLCVAGEPVLGVIYAPRTDELWSGVVGQGTEKNGQPVQSSQRQQHWVSVSETEYRLELKSMQADWMKPNGSTALKLARVSSGEADGTFTMSPRSEWDLAGGHALVRAMGGEVRRRDGQAIVYNQPNSTIEQGFVGGRLSTLDWLEGQFSDLEIPLIHLFLKEDQPAWQCLGEHRNQIDLSEGELCIRYNQKGLLAFMVIDPKQCHIVKAQGDAFHLQCLTRSVTRAFGPLSEA